MPVDQGRRVADFELKEPSGCAFKPDSLEPDQIGVLAFFKVSCPVCQLTFPYLERVYRAFQSEKIAFFGVSQDDEHETQEFRAEFPFSFTSLYDPEPYVVSDQFRIEFVPTIYCIDASGTILQMMEGFSKQGLEQLAIRLARHTSRKRAAIFKPDEGVPNYRPG